MGKVYLRNKTFYADFMFEGQRTQKSLRTRDRAVAERRLQELERRTAMGPSFVRKRVPRKAGLEVPDDSRCRGVYLVMSACGERVKIGKGLDVGVRFRALNSACPNQDLVLAAVLEGYTYVERYLHTEFAEERVHGEWFLCSARVLEFIARAKTSKKLTKVFCRSAWLWDKHLRGRPSGDVDASELPRTVNPEHPRSDRYDDFSQCVTFGCSRVDAETLSPEVLACRTLGLPDDYVDQQVTQTGVSTPSGVV